MFPDLEHLIALQQVDAGVADAQKHVTAHPNLLAVADARLAESVGALDAAQAALQASEETRHALEKEAAVFLTRLAKFRDQQAAVKNNREYQALGHEIETATHELGAVEEREIEAMVEADDLVETVTRAKAALAIRQKEIDREKTALAKDLTAQEARLAEALKARTGLTAKVTPQTMGLYEQVAKVRKGVAMSAAVDDGLCSACHVRLRPHVFQQARKNEAILQCDSCQRILYCVPPQTAPAEADPPAGAAS
jgi:predicted  nucleic acid-binding Zn-ribbon protein